MATDLEMQALALRLMQIGSVFTFLTIVVGLPGQFAASAAERFSYKRGIGWALNVPANAFIGAASFLREDWWFVACNALSLLFSVMILARLLLNSWRHRRAERLIRRGALIREPPDDVLDEIQIH